MSADRRRHIRIEDVAAKAGVSRSTVSRVLNDAPYVSQETRDRVKAIIEQADYSPSAAARSLVTQRNHIIGVVIPHILPVVFEDPFYFPTLLQGVAEATDARDYATLLWWCQSEAEKTRFQQRVLRRNRMMDGLILASAVKEDLLVDRLIKMHTPFVMVERPTAYVERISYVGIDNRRAAFIATEHLLRQGRRRVAHIAGSLDNTDAEDRVTGYRDALAAHGIAFDPALVAEGHFSGRAGYIAMQTLLTHNVDAVFAANDISAFGAMRAIAAAGRRVPDDIAIVGFDDLPNAPREQPALTTIRQPIQQKGAVATALLIDLIEERVQTPRQILLPVQLVIRDSCGASRSLPVAGEHG